MFIKFPVDGDNAVIALGFTERTGAKYEFVARFDFRNIAVLEVLCASDLNDFAIFLEKVCAKLAKRRKFAVGIHDKADIRSRVVRRNSKIVIHKFFSFALAEVIYKELGESDIVGTYLDFVTKYVLWDDVIDWERGLKDYGKKKEKDKRQRRLI